ncbi:uncharacterized protein EI97DRAFT_460139 [Westerdykella ornata]|uniref:VPS37 C-terminal domain-containing protein n=1 Tax=Westerdykella ornata TaxID=318751 RepID=A0A6A6JG14_WESOR|nr:uncharacterized protein EI97DRAFT_460139 [Westerdykella ornata]KAF2274566.1 hypothetical protein EI97DRAFT_460139 [Westerdykella ornata]
MLCLRLLHAATLSFLFLSASAQKYYWISDGCSNDVKDAVTEVIWVAGRVAESISLKESWLDEPMQWMFGFTTTSSAADYVQRTFSRIGALQQTHIDRLSAHVRIYCDNDSRYQAVNLEHQNIDRPSPQTPQFKTTRFYDRDNEAVVLGMSLLCEDLPDSPGVFAHVLLGIESLYYLLNHQQHSTQLADRHTMTLCDKMLARNDDKRPYTWKAFAKRKVQNLSRLQNISPLASHVLMHEFAHVAFLSEQRLTIDTSRGPLEEPNGRDSHPVGTNGKNGYWMPDDTQTLAEKLQDIDWTIMNPDSYAFLATIHRMRDKKWIPYRNDKKFIQLKYEDSLPLKGDWPGHICAYGYTMSFSSPRSWQHLFQYNPSTPPPPPPKPSAHSSGRETPQSGPPLPHLPPPQSHSDPTQAAAPTYPPAQDQPSLPPPEDGWLPDILKDKTTKDLQHVLQTPELQHAIIHNPETTHPSIPASRAPLQALLAQNIALAEQLKNLEAHLRHQRESTQSRLLSLRALERQWRAKQAEQDEALRDFSPPALYQRLSAAVAEQDALCRGLEESFLDGEGFGGVEAVASEREVVEFVRRLREGRKIAYLRAERKERWDEGRVGGWR